MASFIFLWPFFSDRAYDVRAPYTCLESHFSIRSEVAFPARPVILGALSFSVGSSSILQMLKKRAGKIWREQTREDRKCQSSSSECLSKHQ